MGSNLARKLLAAHLAQGELTAGAEIGLRIDQTLCQDATGTVVMLALEAMGLERVRTQLSVQYVDHNILQQDYRNPDDHLFLRSGCRRFGLWYSPPGNGISHPLHLERFGVPGKSLLGADSHTCASGALGMLALGAGGLEVALAMTGQPYHLRMPRVRGIRVTGRLPDWVSAKDAALELLRRHGVEGGRDWILEYSGPGLAGLGVMDRLVLAVMGAELGATSSVFPSDEVTRGFLAARQRGEAWIELAADADATYDAAEELDLSALEPLAAVPPSPANVVPVRELAGREIYQAYLGSSANPGYRDFAVPAQIVAGRRVHDRVSFDLSPSTRQLLETLVQDGQLLHLLHAGARLHQAGCNGCVGMGQAPASGRISLRTVPRNVPGRSGTREDSVYLVSPETAAASALLGQITDPRTLGLAYPRVEEPEKPALNVEMFVPPLPPEEARGVPLERGPNIAALPRLDPLPAVLELPVLLKAGDDVSVDQILPSGTRVMPLRSNIPRIAEYCFEALDPGYFRRALDLRDVGHAVVGGRNWGQGSSREHAALAPRWLGLRVVLAKGFARIHRQNLVNAGIVPLLFEREDDARHVQAGDVLRIEDLHAALREGQCLRVENGTGGHLFSACHDLSAREVQIVLAGGLVRWARDQL